MQADSESESRGDSTAMTASQKADLWLRTWCSVSAIGLIAATYRLWFPQETQSYPLIPVFESMVGIPILVDWLAAAGLIVGWVLFIRWVHLGAAVVLACGVFSLALDQHRIQPWHFQLLVFAGVSALAMQGDRVRWLRAFVISIYVYSAIGKLDYEFLHTIGPQFVQQILAFFGNEVEPKAAMNLAIVLPMIELLFAVGLCLKLTRGIAASGMFLVHVGLVAVLGPLGLNHSPGVVLWNCHFAILVILLFIRMPSGFGGEVAPGKFFDRWPNWCIGAFLLPIMFLPLVERLGYWDHWPSWALYAPHSSRTEMQVAAHRVGDLPIQLSELMPPVDEGTLWMRVPVSEWSLNAVGVPVYPQARYQLGMALSLAKLLDSEFEVRVRMLSSASRWDGKRNETLAEGKSQLKKLARQFWLNTVPRELKKMGGSKE